MSAPYFSTNNSTAGLYQASAVQSDAPPTTTRLSSTKTGTSLTSLPNSSIAPTVEFKPVRDAEAAAKQLLGAPKNYTLEQVAQAIQQRIQQIERKKASSTQLTAAPQNHLPEAQTKPAPTKLTVEQVMEQQLAEDLQEYMQKPREFERKCTKDTRLGKQRLNDVQKTLQVQRETKEKQYLLEKTQAALAVRGAFLNA